MLRLWAGQQVDRCPVEFVKCRQFAAGVNVPPQAVKFFSQGHARRETGSKFLVLDPHVGDFKVRLAGIPGNAKWIVRWSQVGGSCNREAVVTVNRVDCDVVGKFTGLWRLKLIVWRRL